MRTVTETRKPIAQVAKDLDTNETTLASWCRGPARRQDRADGTGPVGESEELAPDVLWWGDMTEIDTGAGKLYLASVHDAFSRWARGYAMGEQHDAALVSAACRWRSRPEAAR
ncbi:hypothetical protein OIU91_03345 [Streptomyces sp. NBC_01456]|uniref:hypothetical protein n=1 Tax=unclassified Streptomyces TaxID=2593676 RepID=UPI002E30D129|nr:MULTISPECIES: hypothetical protein [unclassified Streptomyces]